MRRFGNSIIVYFGAEQIVISSLRNAASSPKRSELVDIQSSWILDFEYIFVLIFHMGGEISGCPCLSLPLCLFPFGNPETLLRILHKMRLPRLFRSLHKKVGYRSDKLFWIANSNSPALRANQMIQSQWNGEKGNLWRRMNFWQSADCHHIIFNIRASCRGIWEKFVPKPVINWLAKPKKFQNRKFQSNRKIRCLSHLFTDTQTRGDVHHLGIPPRMRIQRPLFTACRADPRSAVKRGRAGESLEGGSQFRQRNVRRSGADFTERTMERTLQNYHSSEAWARVARGTPSNEQQIHNTSFVASDTWKIRLYFVSLNCYWMNCIKYK